MRTTLKLRTKCKISSTPCLALSAALATPPRKLLRNLIKQHKRWEGQKWGRWWRILIFDFRLFLRHHGNTDQIKVRIRLEGMRGWK